MPQPERRIKAFVRIRTLRRRPPVSLFEPAGGGADRSSVLTAFRTSAARSGGEGCSQGAPSDGAQRPRVGGSPPFCEASPGGSLVSVREYRCSGGDLLYPLPAQPLTEPE